jgi:CheY-like chemotaxis protein
MMSDVGMDGLEAKADRKTIKAGKRPYIIAMTANAMQGDREMCLKRRTITPASLWR